MVKLTKKMYEVLKCADLERGEINDVPMSTMHGLEKRQLVSSDWLKTKGQSKGGAFPTHSKVKLTEYGLLFARSIHT